MLVIALTVLFSTVAKTNIGVLLGIGGVVLAFYLVGLLPEWGKYLPTFLTDGNALIYGLAEAKAYIPSLLITIIMGVIGFAISVPIFNKKQL